MLFERGLNVKQMQRWLGHHSRASRSAPTSTFSTSGCPSPSRSGRSSRYTPLRMEQMHMAKVEYQEARDLADRASIQQDLTFVVETLSRLADLLREGSEDHVLLRSYWSAALVAYVRCFASGKRVGLSESVFEGIAGTEEPAVDVHRFYKNMRDKHIAHSVNPFDQVEVGLVLSPPASQERRVEGVATLSMSLTAPVLEGVESLRELALIAREKNRAEGKRLEEAVLRVGHQQGLDALYGKATMRTTVPEPKAAGKPRT